MKNIILFVLAILIAMFVIPIGIMYSVLLWIYRMDLKERILNLLFYTAISIDQLWNVVCADLFDFILTKKNWSYAFWDEDETISSVIWKNYRRNTLSFFGKWLYNIIEFIDKWHSDRNIEKTT